MTKPMSDCTGCSLYDSTGCPNSNPPAPGNCSQFISWSDQLLQESAAIERAQRMAWVLLLAASALAALVLTMPEMRA
ncbi:MAG: hypothetical protein OEL88_11445 [Sterolibacteriaceae bacterium MAG5]|nr:hypothetical protein [Candidatus Nitricoxidireducens bremensis]